MAFQVIPRELAFFDLFEEAADNLHTAATEMMTMSAALADREASAGHAAHIKDLEHAGDDLTHQIIHLLNTTFVAPLDRRDIYELASTVDDVLDVLEAVADLIVLYDLTEPMPEFRLQADVMVRATDVLARAMRAIRAPVGMERLWVEIVRLEREADRIYHRGVGSLFSGEFRAMDVLKWQDLLEQMESGVNRCEDAGNAIESIALKYG